MPLSTPKIEGEIVLHQEVSPEEFALIEAAGELFVEWAKDTEEAFEAMVKARPDAFTQNIADETALWMACGLIVQEADAKLKAQASEPYRPSNSL